MMPLSRGTAVEFVLKIRDAILKFPDSIARGLAIGGVDDGRNNSRSHCTSDKKRSPDGWQLDSRRGRDRGPHDDRGKRSYHPEDCHPPHPPILAEPAP